MTDDSLRESISQKALAKMQSPEYQPQAEAAAYLNLFHDVHSQQHNHDLP